MDRIKRVAQEILDDVTVSRRTAAIDRISGLLEYIERNPDPSLPMIVRKMKEIDKVNR